MDEVSDPTALKLFCRYENWNPALNSNPRESDTYQLGHALHINVAAVVAIAVAVVVVVLLLM